VLFGRIEGDSREFSAGVRNGSSGLEVKVDGDKQPSAAALAGVLPLQIIDPDVHTLVAGGPEGRRRYLDWIAFHVEPGYLETWRRFRRALKQRNAAIREGGPLAAWDQEFSAAAVAVDLARRRVLEVCVPVFEETAQQLLRTELQAEYRPGWAEDLDLGAALRAGAERDRLLGGTQAGPHRADLRLSYEARQARKQVSRGQQKLLACALILAATDVVQTHLERPLLLLLDDPAAELDAEALTRLVTAVGGLGSQVIATALTPDTGLFPSAPRLFHVEHGGLRTAS
jgi:DNA replication and repair protein RecF